MFGGCTKEKEEFVAILGRMEAFLMPQSKVGIMDEEGDLCCMSPNSEDSSIDSNGSSSSDFAEEVTSSLSSSASSQSSSDEKNKEGPLFEMSSLVAQLPFKRCLSQHYQGKSQSFTCLSNVRCLEDLAKPERPLRKKLKTSRSCGGGLESRRSLPLKCCSSSISKKASSGRRHSFLRSRPPIPPQRNNSLCGQTLLFA